MIHIVLYQPEIPQNTGNISRTCAATGAVLHLIKPLGFDISDKQVKRAGLDYWHLLEIHVHENFADFLAAYPGANPYCFSTKAKHVYSEVDYTGEEDVFLMFGPETRGLPESLLAARYDRTVRIPMRAEARSLNLSNSVAIAVYETLRQRGTEHLKTEGELTGRGD